MTIEEVASRMGITKGSLSAALSGNPTVIYLTRVADAIDCDISDLFSSGKGSQRWLPFIVIDTIHTPKL